MTYRITSAVGCDPGSFDDGGGVNVNANSRASVTLEAASRQYARNDPAFLQQFSTLRQDLRRAGIEVVESNGAGTKGIGELEPVVQAVVVGGSGLLALCSVAKLWLRQRGDRLIRITVRNKDGEDHVIQIDGKNVSDETLLKFCKDAAKRLE